MTVEAVFTCKDPLIQRYVEEEFGPRFTRVLREAKNPNEQRDVLEKCRNILAKEADRQDWFEYDMCNLGHRHERVDLYGRKEFLIPEVDVRLSESPPWAVPAETVASKPHICNTPYGPRCWCEDELSHDRRTMNK
jgi:hypothetical protein